jgi:hypothetical protein
MVQEPGGHIQAGHCRKGRVRYKQVIEVDGMIVRETN